MRGKLVSEAQEKRSNALGNAHDREGVRASVSQSDADARPVTDAQHRAVIEACRWLEQESTDGSLEELAAKACLSPFHFHRLFKRLLGITPGKYKSALRRAEIQSRLRQTPTITEALYASGFNSPSRFYARARELLGMSPSAWREGGAGTEIDHALVETDLGLLIVAASQFGVCHVAFGEDASTLTDQLNTCFPKARILVGDPVFSSTIEAVAELANLAQMDPVRVNRIPLDIQGTVFQQQVWQALRMIPSGSTVSYSELASAMGHPGAHRAAANACGANRVALLIPCHRVTRQGGISGGYRWGEDRKKALLAKESNPST